MHLLQLPSMIPVISLKLLWHKVRCEGVIRFRAVNSHLNLTIHEQELIYGEVVFWTLARLLELCQVPSGGKFVDLGSGTGKGQLRAGIHSRAFIRGPVGCSSRPILRVHRHRARPRPARPLALHRVWSSTPPVYAFVVTRGSGYGAPDLVCVSIRLR